MELNDELALELLTALDGGYAGVRAVTTEGQRRNSSLSPGNQAYFYENQDGFYETVPTQTQGVRAQAGWGAKSQVSATSLVDSTNQVAVDGGAERVVVGGDTYAVTATHTTVVSGGGGGSMEISADSQQISTAFQRDARRYAP
ncbi:MAG: hypothetical protein R3Y62_00920 [Eubacteriales bacterium]